MIIVGLPCSEQRQMTMSEISGSPYGAGTIAGLDGSRLPSENELAMAHFQGWHLAEIAGDLARGALPCLDHRRTCQKFCVLRSG